MKLFWWVVKAKKKAKECQQQIWRKMLLFMVTEKQKGAGREGDKRKLEREVKNRKCDRKHQLAAKEMMSKSK